MKVRLSLIVSVVVLSLFYSCTPEHSKIIVAKYDDSNITMGEFEKEYAKNVGSLEKAEKDSLSDYKKFLDLLVNFKMKLRDAKVRGFDKDTSITNELNDYRKKIGVSYYLEKELVDKGIKVLYQRRKEELRAKHIMIKADTVSKEQARKEAEMVLNKIKKGEKFEDLVKKYSDDNYSKSKGGDLYYFTAGELPPEFVDAAYNTKVGSVYPHVVQTRYGFHIIKVTERRKRKPRIRVSHIMISFKSKDKNRKPDEALAKIKEIQKKLNNGADFAELAKEYSEDPGSAKRGGDLGFFGRRRMVRPFDEAAFNLKKGEVSGIVRTKFGYHLIKLTDIEPYPTFEKDKESLKKLYKRARYQSDYKHLVDTLKTKFNYAVNNSSVDKIVDAADSAKFKDYYNHTFSNLVKDYVIFSYAGNNNVICDSLFKFIKGDKVYTNKIITKQNLLNAINKYAGQLLIEKKVESLESEDPVFAKLMKDYKEGLYIFKLQQEEVWNKLKVDSAGVYNYYLAHKKQYVMPEKVDLSEIYSRSDSLINKYYKELKNGANFDSLAAKYTERKGFKKKAGHFPVMEVTRSELSKQAAALEVPGEFSKPFKHSGGWSIVKLNKKISERLKTFEEAKAEVSSAFQEEESKRLENEYITRLKGIYNPIYYYDKLKLAYKKDAS